MHRVLIASAAALVLAIGATLAARGAQSACAVQAIQTASGDRDSLTGVAALGDGVVAIGSRYLGPAGVALGATGNGATWDAEMMQAYNGLQVELDDVSVVEDQAWAVGAREDTSPVAAHWDGERWNAMAIGDPGPGEDGLSGVAAVSPDEVWAVGRHQVGSDFVTLIERWDGQHWRVDPSPNTGSSDMLRGVDTTGPNDAWAVGWSVDDGGRYRPLALHRDAAGWTIESTPDLEADDALFTAVAAPSPDDVWAVGWSERGGVEQPLVERWDGHSWAVVDPPDEAQSELLAVAAMPGKIVVAGRGSMQGQPTPLVAVWTRGMWAHVSVPNQGSTWLVAVAIDASGRLWSVGPTFPGNTVATGFVVSGCQLS